MTWNNDIRIASAADVVDLCDINVDRWNVGRSGEIAPGVEVWTTWLPTCGCYESLVLARPTSAALRQALSAWHHHSERYETRAAAQDGHAALVSQIRTLIEAAS